MEFQGRWVWRLGAVFKKAVKVRGPGAAVSLPPLRKRLSDTKKQRKKEDSVKGSKLYVGNLSYSVTAEQLEELFSSHGEVKQVNIIENRGFGFVEMSGPAEAEKAKEALDGSEFEGRTLRVNEARPPRKAQRGGYRRY